MGRSKQRSLQLKQRNKDKKSSDEGQNQLAILPPEIISDILSRPPIESILRCRSVCKSWNTLIKNPSFTEIQLNRTRTLPCQAILQLRYGNTLLLLNFQNRTIKKIPFKQMKLPAHMEFKLSGSLVISSCNGLLCIAPKMKIDPVLVCNPMTRECLALPSSELKMRYTSHQLGFHYDPSSSRYKVIREYKYRENEVSRFQILSIGDSSWRELASPQYVLDCVFRAAVYWNGAFHWKIQEEDHRRGNNCILSFDLGEEAFFTIPYICQENPGPSNYEIRAFGGNLNLVDRSNLQLMRMWKVAGNKVQGFSICLQREFRVCVPRRLVSGYDFICQPDEDNYLLHVFGWEPGVNRWSLVNFAPGGEQFFKVWEIPGLPAYFRIICYKPSFVSPIAAASQVGSSRALLH
ncbi:hypothetical protein Tsubulata_049785 [Turnera subulata]|uniref:F-box domain-containing protein n=1 Tax=Turnera subulata TaxID=218843 RepID=A0A9Q0G8K0_9ROSI|nr:hypothetical protein Tsubulata_049785 [Turnera subulata]